jgi:hypothetical protein
MKIQKDIVVPASIRTQNVWVCDDCGKEIGGFHKCNECGADVCYKCSSIHPEDTGGDNTDYICKSCLKVFKCYEQDIWELQEKIDELEKLRSEGCKEQRKDLNEINKTKLSDTNKA